MSGRTFLAAELKKTKVKKTMAIPHKTSRLEIEKVV